MLRALGGVDRQLLPAGGRVAGPRGGERVAVTLADADPLERNERSLQHPAELGQDGGYPSAVADRDDHHRYGGVAVEEAGPLARTVRCAVHTEQDGGAGDAFAVQQRHYCPVCRLAADPLVAADVDGQLG